MPYAAEMAPQLCASCAKVLPVDPRATPFACLGLMPPRFSIDAATLDALWTTRARKVHPDRFATKSDKERRFSAEQTTALNSAKALLTEPYDRALWLVTRAGVTPMQLDSGYLVELMEAREDAEQSSAQRAQVIAGAREQFDATLAQLARTLATHDAAPDGYSAPTAALKGAARALARMKTLARLVDDLGGGKLISTLDGR